MNTPKNIFQCENMQDAYFLRDQIQRVSTIPVRIERTTQGISILVDKGNCNKAKNIIIGKLNVLPSAYAKSVVEEDDSFNEDPDSNGFLESFKKLNHVLSLALQPSFQKLND